MIDYKQYIDATFSNPNTLKTRDRAPCVCPCGKVTVIYIANLKSTIKKFGDYKCRSCRGTDAWKRSKGGSKLEIEPIDYSKLKEVKMDVRYMKIPDKLKGE